MNCSQLYLGLDEKVAEHVSEFFTVELKPSASEEVHSVQKILTTRFIYYLAPHTGCGCGWDFLDIGTSTDEMSRQSCNHLAAFLAECVEQTGKPCKIYSVCSCSVGALPQLERELSINEFIQNISEYRVPYSSTEARLFVVASQQAVQAGQP